MTDSSQQNTPRQPEQQAGQQYNGDNGQFQPAYAVPHPEQGSPSPAQRYVNQPSPSQPYPNQPYSGQQSQPAQAQPYVAQPAGPYSGAAAGPAGADMVYWEAKGIIMPTINSPHRRQHSPLSAPPSWSPGQTISLSLWARRSAFSALYFIMPQREL